jgi:hypothetical protein
MLTAQYCRSCTSQEGETEGGAEGPHDEPHIAAGSSEGVCKKARGDPTTAGLLGGGPGRLVAALALPDLGAGQAAQELHQPSKAAGLGQEGGPPRHGDSTGDFQRSEAWL